MLTERRVGVSSGANLAFTTAWRAASAVAWLLCLGRAWEKDTELLAADATEQVSRPQRRADGSGDDPECRIALVVAETVVDGLEVVDIEDKERSRRRGRGLAQCLQCSFDPVGKGPPVEEPGQTVGRGEDLKLIVGDGEVAQPGGEKEQQRPGQHDGQEQVGQEGTLERCRIKGRKAEGIDTERHGDAKQRAQSGPEPNPPPAAGRKIQ